MARTTNRGAGGGVRAIGPCLAALGLSLALVEACVAAQEAPSFQIREFGVISRPTGQPISLQMKAIRAELKITDSQNKEQAAIIERRLAKIQQVRRAPRVEGGQLYDPSFDPTVARPAYAHAAQPPRVLFDEAHNNFHTAGGSYKPFADLITSDGYAVIPNREKFSGEVLQKGDILVIANATGGKGVRSGGRPFEPAFTDAECDAVRDWVKDGGALLLIADHSPWGSANECLAKRFEVNMGKGATSDPANSQGNAAWLLFTRENHLLGDHPITVGRDDSERLNRVQTFMGTSLKGPEGSTPILKLADTAVDRLLNNDPPVSAAGRAQGLALSFGKGRVVVLGEAGELTARLSDFEGGKSGMNVPGLDNRQMALNIMHWLSGLLEPREQEPKKAR